FSSRCYSLTPLLRRTSLSSVPHPRIREAIMKRIVVLAVAFFFPLLTTAAEPKVGWTPETLLKLKRIGGVYPSPDGKRVAYTVREAVMQDSRSEYVTQIHLVNADGTEHVQLTRGTQSSENPQWSPDGKTIAFTSNRSGKTNLFLIPV